MLLAKILLQWWTKHCQNTRNLKENYTGDLFVATPKHAFFFFLKNHYLLEEIFLLLFVKKMFGRGMHYFFGLEVGNLGLQWLLVQILKLPF